MSRITEALQGLGLYFEIMLRSNLAFPVDASKECRRLVEVTNEFSKKGGTVKARTPRADAEEVWRYLSAQNYDLSVLDARQVMALCASPETATRPELVRELQREGSVLKRTSCLVGLVFSYFARWGSIPHQDQMESLIKRGLTGYQKRNPVVLDYRNHANDLFSPRSAETLAKMALDDWRAPNAVLDQFHIGLSTRLSTATISAAVREFFSRYQGVHRDSYPRKHLEYALSSLLITELPRTDFYAAVSALILHDWSGRHPQFQETLRRFVLQHNDLGDPRIKTANWVGMNKAAAERFLSWIAKESIIFFFNHVLPDNSLNRRRKDFWLNYVGSVQDFQVALSEQHHRRLVATSRLSDVPGFARVKHPTTSAFIMRFGVWSGKDIIIVEFSETGNAAHKFDAVAFEAQAGKLRRVQFEFGSLKHKGDENRILHVPPNGWESRAFNKMAEWGVRR